MIRAMRLRPVTLVGIVFSMVGGVVLGVVAFRALDSWLGAGAAEQRLLMSVLDHVDRNYVGEVSREELINDAIAGMIGGLDGHSSFLRDDKLVHLHQDTTGRFGGIGLEIALVGGYFTVMNPIDGTPADRAGMLSGDRIVEIDHVSLKGRTRMQVVSDMRGRPGTPVHVRVRRPGEERSRDFELVRDVIETNSVRGRMLEPGFGYLRITQFQDTTEADLERAFESLAEESAAGGIKGLILDLRNNPGGVLGAAVDVADAFLDDGLIVYTESRAPAGQLEFLAEAGDLLAGAPLAILINRRSASGSEVVAGALQDHGRAVILGSRSFGKGSVQSVMTLRHRRAIKLTTAHYYTPRGRSIQAAGIEPDIPVAFPEGASFRDYDELIIATALGTLKDSGAVSGRTAASAATQAS